MNSRRLLFALLLPCFLIAACGDSGGTDGRLSIAVIPKGTSHEFWKSIHAGAVKAQRELGEDQIEIVWRGPQKEDDRDQQINLVQGFVGSGASAIVLAPLDDRALVSPVRLAMDADIPVVIIDSGIEGEPGKDYVSYIATDNREGGKLCGEELARLLDGKGRVLMLRYMEGSASTIQREKGFLEAMARHDGITIVEKERYAGASRDSARTASLNLLEAHADIDGIFCSNESATVGMMLALGTRDLLGKMRFVGFDASPRLVEGLEKGHVDALAVQNPVAMGYRGVMTAVAKLRGEPFESHQDTGVVIVTKANMGEPAVAALLNPPLEEYLGR